MRSILVFAILAFACQFTHADSPTTQPAITWNFYGDDAFARAKRDHKLIILDLQAVWCHWCHVMDEKTYSNPDVQKLLKDNFVAIKVDQDSRPDISNRYEDYGWPATIVFDSDGHEIVKRRGFIPPDQMIAMLKACVADPTPGPSIEVVRAIHPATQPALSPQVKAKLTKDLSAFYDEKNAGWGTGFKFIDADLISTAPTATGTIRILKKSCPTRPTTCEPSPGPSRPGTIRMISMPPRRFTIF
jgi:uncharacterized protein YyaL (SSP411 family)